MGKKNSLIKNPKILLMGVINLTPDSFSDGGKFNTLGKALKQAKKLESDGADILDIGGESTGPNAKPITLKEELKRVIPILKEIRKSTKLPISIDTYKSEVAKKALEAGANIINDVTALRGDKNMVKIAAKYKCPIILMYSKDKTPHATIKKTTYKDIIETIKKFLTKQIAYAEKSGIKRKNIIIDPGMGQFISATAKYSFEIIARLKELETLKRPILMGISRKSFLQEDISSREGKAKALSAIAYINGVSIIRTHDVKGTKEFLKKLNN